MKHIGSDGVLMDLQVAFGFTQRRRFQANRRLTPALGKSWRMKYSDSDFAAWRLANHRRSWRMKHIGSDGVFMDLSIAVLFHYFLLDSLGVTQVPVALATTIGSSKKSAAEALMSVLAAMTFLASNFIFLEVFPTLVISP